MQCHLPACPAPPPPHHPCTVRSETLSPLPDMQEHLQGVEMSSSLHDMWSSMAMDSWETFIILADKDLFKQSQISCLTKTSCQSSTKAKSVIHTTNRCLVLYDMFKA
ncbi:hypothetical protein ILYODFUR_027693 [Ilyodon furcidens]|uniref:Uncharacterized protein n=1 Tax=Ilyodon furcidens TaxID=33524 RepID=A0ABV0SPS0_9TELE